MSVLLTCELIFSDLLYQVLYYYETSRHTCNYEIIMTRR